MFNFYNVICYLQKQARATFETACLTQRNEGFAMRGLRSTGAMSILMAATFAHAVPADVDVSFGAGGKIFVPANATSTQFGLSSSTIGALQSDGKLVVLVAVMQSIEGAINSSKLSWQIRRFTATGLPDLSFGSGGVVTLSFDVDFSGFRGNDYPGGIDLMADGRIVVAGQSLGQCNLGCPARLVMARLNSDGTLDNSFGINGKATSDTVLGADAVAVQSDRKILAAGNQNIGRARIWFMELHRFNVDGSLDPNFAAAIACPGNGTFRLAPDGKIVIVTAIPAVFADPLENPGFCVSRLNADGSLDTAFGTQGKTIVKAGVNVAIGDLVVDAAGAIIVVGSTTKGAAIRLASNGSLDAAFGVGGIVETDVIAKISAAIGDCSSRTIVAGPGPDSGAFSTGRLLPTGAIDASFAGTPSGFAQTTVGSTPYPLQLLVRPDGRVVVLAIDRTSNVLNILQFHGDPACGGAAGGTVVEFHNTILDTYFITANPNEAAAIDNGSAGPGWSRTGFTFKSGGTTAVCRFYGSLSPGPNSHFYTLAGPECNSLVQLQVSTPSTQKRWNFESLDFVSTPAGTGGTCPTGTLPVYRAYNNGFARGIDSNHRLTTSQQNIADLVARGWRSEGVVMCAPETTAAPTTVNAGNLDAQRTVIGQQRLCAVSAMTPPVLVSGFRLLRSTNRDTINLVVSHVPARNGLRQKNPQC